LIEHHDGESGTGEPFSVPHDIVPESLAASCKTLSSKSYAKAHRLQNRTHYRNDIKQELKSAPTTWWAFSRSGPFSTRYWKVVKVVEHRTPPKESFSINANSLHLPNRALDLGWYPAHYYYRKDPSTIFSLKRPEIVLLIHPGSAHNSKKALGNRRNLLTGLERMMVQKKRVFRNNSRLYIVVNGYLFQSVGVFISSIVWHSAITYKILNIMKEVWPSTVGIQYMWKIPESGINKNEYEPNWQILKSDGILELFRVRSRVRRQNEDE